MASTNLIYSLLLLCLALHGSLIRGQSGSQNGSCVAAVGSAYGSCLYDVVKAGDCYCDWFCYTALDCCPDIVQTCRPPDGDYVCYQNSQCTQLVSPSSAASVNGCCNSVGVMHFVHISEPTECIPCSELQVRNGSRESLRCVNTMHVVSDTISIHWEKLTTPLNGSTNCSDLNLGDASSAERVLASNSSIMEFDPVLFGDEGCYRCIAAGVPSDLIYTVTVSPEGSVSAFPLDMTFKRGYNVTFNCSAQGGPGNTYQWVWNGTDLDNETAQTLALTQISVNNGGEYTCVVSNAAGSDNASTLLNVAPEIVLNPSNVDARNGTVLVLMCEAQAFPEPQYRWIRVSKTFSENVAGDINSTTLVFDPVMFEDEGGYYCTVTSNGVAVISDGATLTVSPEGSVSAFPLDMTFKRGDNVTFNCSAQGGPGNTYQWMWNGTDLDNETAQTLALTQISVDDGGEYTCVVSNAAGSDNASTLLNVAPEIVLNPSNVNARNGTVLVLMCEAQAFPEPQYRWIRVSKTFSENVAGDINSTTLVFDPVMFEDEGGYYCTVTSNGVAVISDGATLTVSPEGSVRATPKVINAERNTTVEFTCSAQGGPGNNFTWIRMSDGADAASVSVLQIAVEDAFVGSDYQCLVVNEAGNDTVTVNLNVAPLILNAPSDLNVATAGNVNLMCRASGYPMPSISWTHNGTAVNETDQITIKQESSTRVSTSVLIISAAAANDSGEYTCIVSSPVSDFQTVSSEPVNVFVEGNPTGHSSTKAIIIGVVTGVAIIAISVVVVVIFLRWRATSCSWRNLNKRSDARPVPEGTNMNMTECPAYVEIRHRHQQNANDANDEHIYECIGLPFHVPAETCDHHYEEPAPRARGNVYHY